MEGIEKMKQVRHQSFKFGRGDLIRATCLLHLLVTEYQNFLTLQIYVLADDLSSVLGVRALEKLNSKIDIRQNILKTKITSSQSREEK